MSTPQLSWTSLEALFKCHLQYTLRFVDWVQAEEESRHFIEGRALHAGLARWWKLPLKEKQAGRLAECMDAGFDAEDKGVEWRGDFDRPQALERVHYAGRNAVAVIKEHRLLGCEPFVERSFVTRFGGFILRGRFDLFLETMDGELALVDYKYSSTIRSANRLQLVTQAIGVNALTGVWPTQAGFLYCKGETRHLRRIRFSEAEIGRFAAILKPAWQAYEAAPREPSFNPYRCDWCSAKSGCQVYQDTHPGAQRGDIIHGNRRRIDL